MTEAFLQYVWRHQLMSSDRLFTTNNEEISVIKIGTFNSDAGPDFLNAKIKIGDTVWAGDVEIHIKSSNWNQHKHNRQKAYNSVILHVVSVHDKEIQTENGMDIPTLVMPILPHITENYNSLMSCTTQIRCAKQLPHIDDIHISLFLERLVAERFEEKAKRIAILFSENNHDWKETLYQQLARNFGLKTNSDAFENLAKNLPLIIIEKHHNDLFQIEALLFGQANIWSSEENCDEYELSLRKEYSFLQKKYGLTPISHTWWKFARLRPCNFPTIRIAQFAHLIYTSQSLASKIIESTSLENVSSLLTCKASSYWETHYSFGKKSPKHSCEFGSLAIVNSIINTVIPFLFAYGKTHNDEAMTQRALDLLRELPPEKNAVITKWEECGIAVPDAFTSQGLLHLYTAYCEQGICFHCRIGHIILNKK